MLYGSPCWYTALTNKKLVLKLTRIQRKLAIRICSAYRTISAEAAGVIVAIPPIELQASERKNRYSGVPKSIARGNLMHSWQQKWKGGTHGRWTYSLIPDLQVWTNRPFGEVDYFLSQALSGHDCFRRRGELEESCRRAESPNCQYCQAEDDVEHTLFICTRWQDARTAFLRKTGGIFSAENKVFKVFRVEKNHGIMPITQYDLSSKAKKWRIGDKKNVYIHMSNMSREDT
ncbi:uncharacterized protein [Leptinotarsa decemlineata]|uniref:uncharacterized protein n=1 Tax=Leptinotarsa decemlineata TaxID=7539 RepID=UPI003D306A7C